MSVVQIHQLRPNNNPSLFSAGFCRLQNKNNNMFDPNVQKKLLGHKVKDVALKDELTNRELREKTLLSLARKFKPHLAKALKRMINLVENENTPPATQYQAAKFVIEFHKDLVGDLYKDKYDGEVGQEIQTESAPVFSLRMVENTKSDDLPGKG